VLPYKRRSSVIQIIAYFCLGLASVPTGLLPASPARCHHGSAAPPWSNPRRIVTNYNLRSCVHPYPVISSCTFAYLRFDFFFKRGIIRRTSYRIPELSDMLNEGLTRLHRYGIQIRQYGYVDTVMWQLKKIRIHRYNKYIYNFINKYYEDNAQS
jgi:hypothetical protein